MAPILVRASRVARACIDQILEDMLAGISATEREEFARILTMIGTNLGARRDNKVPING